MKLFELYATLGLDKSGFDQGVDSAVSKGDGAGKKIGNSFGLIKKALVAAGVVIAVKKIGDAFVDMGEKADAIDESSQKLGLSRKAYQEWGYVLSQNGGNIESFGVGMKTLQNAMVQGTDATNAAFAALGLSADKLKAMAPEDALSATIKAFQAMPAGAEKSALAMDLFGKQGMELLPTLNMTADATEALKKRANDLGLVLSDEAIDAGGKFADNMATLKLGLAAVGTNIISKLMPAVSKFIDKIIPLMDRILPALTDAFGKIFEAIWPLIEGGLDVLSDVLTWVADNIDTLLPIIGVLVAALVAWKVVQIALNLAAAANPIGLIIIGIAALIAGIVLLVQNFDSVKAWLSGVGQWVYDTVIAPIVGFFVSLWNTISTAASSAWTFIVGIWEVVSTWFNDNVIVPVVGFFAGLWLSVKNLFSTLWDGVVQIWVAASTWFNTNITKPIQKLFEDMWGAVSTAASNVWTTITGWINGIIALANTAITTIKTMLGLKGWESPEAQAAFEASTGGKTWEQIVAETEGHATGLRYVPYDNYLTRLHEGEEILTKADATEHRKGSSAVGISASSLASLRDAIVDAVGGMAFVGEFDGRELYRAVRKVGMA